MKTTPASKSLLISLAIVFGVLVSVSIHSTAHAQSVSVGSPQVAMSPSQRASYYWPDGNMGAIYHNGTNYVFGMTANPGDIQITLPSLNTWTSGLSLDTPAANLTFGGSNSFDQDYIGGEAVYYDSASGYLLQLYHGEQHFGQNPDVQSYSALGLAYSTDFGNTWHKLGEVISPQSAWVNGGADCQADVANGTLLVVGSYFYVYYDDNGTGCAGEAFAVARAPISSVIAAVKAGTPFTSGSGALFMKYTGNGTWNGNGVTDLANPQNGGGAFATLAYDINGRGIWSPSVRYDSYTNQYILTSTNFDEITLMTSSDGLTWGNAQNIVTGGGDPPNALAYPTLFNTSGGDPQALGQTFSVFYVSPFGNWSSSNLMRVQITLSGGSGSPTPPPTPAPTTGTDTTAPSVPTGVTAPAYSNTSIGVGWSASTDNVGVAGYKVYRNGTQLGTTANLGWLDTNLNAGTSYSYTVAAYDAAGNVSAQSTAVTGTTTGGSTAPVADTTPPSVPTGLSATAASPTQVNLSWNPSTDNVAVTGYKIYRNGSQIAGTTNPSYSDTGLAAATSYSYTIAAYDAAGNLSSQSGGVSVTTQSNAPATDTTPPSVPTDVQAPAYSNTSIGVGWDPSTDNVAVTGYKVYRNGSQLGTTPNTGWLDTNLNSGTTYNYTISAFDAAGNVSALSASVAGTTSGGTTTPPPTTPPPTTPPPTPTPTPTTSGNTITAASSNESDVAAAVAAVSNGGTVFIPCSPSSVTWTTGVTVANNITITGMGATPNTSANTFGSGSNCLTILDNDTSGSLFNFAPTYSSSNNLATLQDINIDPQSANTQVGSWPVNVVGTCTSSGCPNFREDNIYFGKSQIWSYSSNGIATLNVINDVFGVADHNTTPNGTYEEVWNVNLPSYLGVGQYGDNSWAQPDSFGGASNFFVENNSLYNSATVTEGEFPSVATEEGGGRQVDRFNQIISAASQGTFGWHGLDTSGRTRAGREMEVYGNTVQCASGSCNILAGFRDGTGMVFGNTLTTSNGGYFNGFAFAADYRSVYTNSQWGACGDAASGSAAGPYDANDGVTYYSGTAGSGSSGLTLVDTSKSWSTNQLVPLGAPYSVWDVTKNFVAEISSNTSNSVTIQSSIVEQTNAFSAGDSYQIRRSTSCVDQPGRGQGNYVSGWVPTPAGSLNQALDPIYEWDDSYKATSMAYGDIAANTGRVIANRDYYTDNSYNNNAESGPHAQTSPTSPFNGSTSCNYGSGSYSCGVGFGTLANRPTSCTTGVGYWATDQGNWNTSNNSFGQGELYKCTSTNTWNLAYVPYTYPDPLITGAAAVTPPPITTPPPVTTPPAPTPASTLFTIGESVTVSSGPLNVRSTASTSGTAVGTETTGNIGTVTGGPTAANGYNWWQVKWNDGLSGWSVENYMAAAPVVTTPPPTPTPTTGTDTTPPSVPTNVQAPAYSNTSIGVTWTASTDNVGVTGYKVYRNGTLLGTDPNTGYLDTNLTPGTTYSYTVQAYDAAGNVSALSVAVSGTTSGGTTTPPPTPTPTSTPATGPDNTPPSTPTGLSVTTVSQSELRITWTASTDNVGVTGYNIYRNGALLGTTANATYLDTNLQTNTTYSYTVQALDAAGNASPQSKGASGMTGNVTTTPPPTPTSTTASGITSPLIESATVGSPFNYQITATNNPTAYYISGLPSGLSGNSAYGTISGIPTVAGTYQVTIGSTAPGSYVQAIMTLTVNGTATANSGITSPLIESATVGSPFNYQITATNNPTAYYISGLPSGLSGNSAYGTIMGTPAVAGTYSVTVGSTAPGSYVQAIMTLTVNGAGTTPVTTTPPVTIPTVLPTSTAGLENLIAQLEAELTALQGQSNSGGSSGTTPTKTTPGPTVSAGTFTRNLSLGSSGADVTALQTVIIQDNAGPAAQALAAVGATGTFGTLTKNALIELQKALGVPATGFFGPLTRSKVEGGE